MNKYLLILSFLVLIDGQAQETINVEKFDIRNFNDRVAAGTTTFTLENGDKVQQFTGSEGKGYVERITRDDTPYGIVRVYHPNGFLHIQGKEFYGFPIGVYREYSETGKLIKETNYDEPYKFSVDDMAKKMKEEYNIDIMTPKAGTTVTRYKKSPFPEYQIFTPKENYYLYDVYTINAVSGEGISIKIVNGKTDEEKIIFQKR